MAIFGIKYREIGDFRLEFGIWHFSIFIPPPFPENLAFFGRAKPGKGGDNLAFGILARTGSSGTCPPVGIMYVRLKFHFTGPGNLEIWMGPVRCS